MEFETSEAGDELRQFIERIERMEEEKAAVAADIKEIFAEAKGRGYDTKVLRAIVKIRKQDPNERAEHLAILELYMSAIGMSDAPVDPGQRAEQAFAKTQEKSKRRREADGWTPTGFAVGEGV